MIVRELKNSKTVNRIFLIDNNDIVISNRDLAGQNLIFLEL